MIFYVIKGIRDNEYKTDRKCLERLLSGILKSWEVPYEKRKRKYLLLKKVKSIRILIGIFFFFFKKLYILEGDFFEKECIILVFYIISWNSYLMF